MKTIKRLSAMLLAVAACAAWPAMAQTNTAPATNAPAPARPRPMRFNSLITSVDSTNMILSLKARPGTPDHKVKITSQTKIQKDGQPAQFMDAVEGLRASGAYKIGDDGVWTATTLNILKPRTPRPPPAAAPAPQ